MMRTVSLTIFLLTAHFASGQDRLDDLWGTWQIVNYYSPSDDSLVTTADGGCSEFLILEVRKRGKLKFSFTDKKDTVRFSGRVTLNKKNNKIHIQNNIHEIIHLGELENCISASLRIDLRSAFYRVFDFSITNENTLIFYYDFPLEPKKLGTLTFKRIVKS
jgi:hypothetical protein